MTTRRQARQRVLNAWHVPRGNGGRVGAGHRYPRGACASRWAGTVLPGSQTRAPIGRQSPETTRERRDRGAHSSQHTAHTLRRERRRGDYVRHCKIIAWYESPDFTMPHVVSSWEKRARRAARPRPSAAHREKKVTSEHGRRERETPGEKQQKREEEAEAKGEKSTAAVYKKGPSHLSRLAPAPDGDLPKRHVHCMYRAPRGSQRRDDLRDGAAFLSTNRPCFISACASDGEQASWPSHHGALVVHRWRLASCRRNASGCARYACARHLARTAALASMRAAVGP